MFSVLTAADASASTSGTAIDLDGAGLKDGDTFEVFARNASTSIACYLSVDGDTTGGLPVATATAPGMRVSSGLIRYVAGTTTVSLVSASGTPTVRYSVRKLVGGR